MIHDAGALGAIGGGKPRASGDDPPVPGPVDRRPEVNPARAGMIPMIAAIVVGCAGKPRASGDDPAGPMAVDAHWA